MRPALLVALGALVAILDISAGSTVRAFGGSPSVAVALLAVWGVVRPREEALLIAPAAGVTLGLLGQGPLGAPLLALLPVVLLGAIRAPEASGRRLTAVVLIAITGAVINAAVLTGVDLIAARQSPPPIAAVSALVGAALLTAPVALLIYCLVARFAWQPRAPGEFRR